MMRLTRHITPSSLSPRQPSILTVGDFLTPSLLRSVSAASAVFFSPSLSLIWPFAFH